MPKLDKLYGQVIVIQMHYMNLPHRQRKYIILISYLQITTSNDKDMIYDYITKKAMNHNNYETMNIFSEQRFSFNPN